MKVYLFQEVHFYINHISHNRAIQYPCIMLCHTCGGMAEHDGHVLQGYIVGERDGGPESVPGNVERKK